VRIDAVQLIAKTVKQNLKSPASQLLAAQVTMPANWPINSEEFLRLLYEKEENLKSITGIRNQCACQIAHLMEKQKKMWLNKGEAWAKSSEGLDWHHDYYEKMTLWTNRAELILTQIEEVSHEIRSMHARARREAGRAPRRRRSNSAPA
jgi:hypothetical protein